MNVNTSCHTVSSASCSASCDVTFFPPHVRLLSLPPQIAGFVLGFFPVTKYWEIIVSKFGYYNTYIIGNNNYDIKNYRYYEKITEERYNSDNSQVLHEKQ